MRKNLNTSWSQVESKKCIISSNAILTSSSIKKNHPKKMLLLLLITNRFTPMALNTEDSPMSIDGDHHTTQIIGNTTN